MKNGGSWHRAFWPLALVWVVADYATKRWAESTLTPYGPVNVLGEWFRWRLAYNPGAAFSLSLGPYSRWIFMVIAAVAVVGIAWKARDADWNDRLRQIAAALVVGGAAGNLIDRIRGAAGVVDFIDVGIGMTRWPTFNVADMGVSCGAVALAISFWLEDARKAKEAAVTPSSL
ncbi:MAG: signal peptidase II [Gemmatimonadetes bacterium]|nr:signal peptidase II [Gemmatimonadota bacterium]